MGATVPTKQKQPPGPVLRKPNAPSLPDSHSTYIAEGLLLSTGDGEVRSEEFSPHRRKGQVSESESRCTCLTLTADILTVLRPTVESARYSREEGVSMR